MTRTHYIKILISLFIGAPLLVPVFAMAQLNSADINANVNANAEVRTNAGVGATLSATTTARMEKARTRAAQEIERRIEALTKINVRIGGVTKISDQFKANLDTNIQNQITALTALKVKIEGDTDLNTLKTDVQSITKLYRIFALIMPQTHIAAMADRTATAINIMIGIGNKLQTRLTEMQNAGADVSAIIATLSDMGAKISDAQAKAQAAVDVTATLVPDNGDKDKMAANKAALTEGRDNLKEAHQDLVNARKYITTILKGIRELSASSSATVETQ
ncbi:hypothetical protein A3D68_00265 [Candidatus Adlerbacteria bacterium RIFCSPHIGHO2_02_FULL_52_17]|uniref:DUF5667 domain-containing protein n=1 Tax=Candidatus Adlerbacteria bacterium RIFCSPHIGHO2_02_FULL_52_17 TaxID=1797240 RepID=A0A1F4XMC1_9BACT|nr:MAG: hypothetical protein A3D68_00265 [Candidatus Adlerbacteria bacterium RIFCSPHIGHO2_02_FULL_52_17]